VRELRNVMQRAGLLAPGTEIAAADLRLADETSGAVSSSASAASSSATPEVELDREAIEAALARTGGVVSQAAAELGLSRQALYRRLERLGIGRRDGG
jgi:DNA-binding NtrC family response regulator